jgi:succinyl-CoA synthetase beta subunit
MKLLEYKAKELVEKYGIKIMRGVVIEAAGQIETAEISYPAVVKAQVQAGGRGKAGGIKFAENKNEARGIIESMLGSYISGYKTDKILITEKLEIKDEWYLAVMLDRAEKCPLVIFSAEGGADIEETARTKPESIVKIHVNPLVGIKDYTVRYIIAKSGAPLSYLSELTELLKKLYGIFTDYSCLLAEINPLALAEDGGGLVAVDGKIDIDDSAVNKFQDIAEFAKSLSINDKSDLKIAEAAKFDFLYIPVESGGEVGVMSNGSGMIMSCIDQFALKNIKIGAALDLGGGAAAERIKEAVRIMLDGDKIRVLFISIFGGITRCDEVANGVRAALENISADKRIVLRIEGTNKKEGLEILRGESRVTAVENIPDGVNLIYERLC